MKQTPTFKDAALLVVKHYGTHLKLAQALGYDDLRNVSAWANGLRPFPTYHCVTIEKDSNGVITRRMLRPHDLALHWPELAKTAKAA